MMNGASVIGSAPLPAAAQWWTIAGVADFDNANGLDLLWQNGWPNSTDPTPYWIYLLSTTAELQGNGGVNAAPGYVPADTLNSPGIVDVT